MEKQANFLKGVQLGLDLRDGAEAVPISPHAVRLQLNALIDRAKASRDEAPWDEKTHRHHQLVFPQLVKCLPPEEGEFLRRQFELELERIEKLLAA